MKKSIANITTRTLMGFFALGLSLSLVLGLFAGCVDILGDPPAGLTGGGPAEGTGRVLIRLGNQAEGARTFMPTVDYDTLSYTFTYTFTSAGKTPVSGAMSEGTATADLAAGIWTLTVEGVDSNTGGGALNLKGTVTGIEVSPGTSTPVSVHMKVDTEAGVNAGTLNYSVTFPIEVSRGTLTVYGWDNDEEQGTPLDLAAEPDTDSDTDTKTVSGSLSLPAGYYRVSLDLYKADGVLSRTDIAHIYPDLTTEAPYTIAAEDFTAATVDSAQTSLADVLGSVSGLAVGANTVYFLPAGGETLTATSVSRTDPVTLTIDGGGRVVTLDNSGGSLITVGNNVTLVLKNITLKGRGSNYNNSAALVRVESGGTLETGTGVLITANRNYHSSSHGGGVYVDGGTFTMHGGEIAGNTASSSDSSFDYSFLSAASHGGGVYVDGGTFTMHGGEIAGNTAYSYSHSSLSFSFSDGGGVYVDGGTFTMSGGEIAGNTASSYSYPSSSPIVSHSSSRGGGVYVGGGTFTMSGGEIAGNTAYSYSSHSYSYSYSDGGGVYVGGGTFTMSGGEIAGNTASSSSTTSSTASYSSDSYGGGVCVYDGGTFTMSGGKIAGNTASSSSSTSHSYSYGGGVYVYDSGTFTKSGQSTIYGSNALDDALKNTAQNDSRGHAVYVSSGGKKRNTTVGEGVTLNSDVTGAAGGWVDHSTVTGITYDNAWNLQSDGRRKSPAISNSSVTKARVSFTATAGSIITIQLDVSSESGWDYAFISRLDNGSATYYYTGSRISGTQSVTVEIPVTTAGSHFVDICYQKDSGGSSGSDCAWFKVVE